MASGNGFTPTEKRMMDVLRDRMPHTRDELHACLSDELQPVDVITVHLTNIRKKLPENEDILIRFINRRTHYVLARIGRRVASASD